MPKSPYPSIPAPDASIESVAYVVTIMKTVLDQLTGQVTDKVTSVGNAPPRVFIQATTPEATKTGDLWINTATNNALFYYNGTQWAPVSHG